jgi:archaellum biogenesis ATPase FlaH
VRSTFQDPRFQVKLVTLLVKDTKVVRQCSSMLETEDFEPRQEGESHAAWHIAGTALDYWRKYREPIDTLLGVELARLSEENNWGERLKGDLREYIRLVRRTRPKAADYALEIIRSWRKHQLRTTCIDEIINLHTSGGLTDSKFLEICGRATSNFREEKFQVSNIFSSTGEYEDDCEEDQKALKLRDKRRADQDKVVRIPRFMMQPVDDMITGIGRGHLGMIMAPTGRGKSMMLTWMAVVLAQQGWSVLYFTLEDPLDDVENRLDALITSLKIKDLANPDVADKMGLNFQNYRRNVRGRLRVVDCTEQDTSLGEIEAEWERMRQQGWMANCVIIDYDQILKTPVVHSDKRHELDSLYVDMVHFARRNRVLIWTASQTYAKAEDKVGVLTMNDLAEHKGKLRHVTMGISLGKADEKKWPKGAICVGVPKHRNDVSFESCTIVPDMEYMRIYDHEKTIEATDEVSDLPPRETPDPDAKEDGSL